MTNKKYDLHSISFKLAKLSVYINDWSMIEQIFLVIMMHVSWMGDVIWGVEVGGKQCGGKQLEAEMVG
jgi:hypothetical protein